MLGLCLSMKVVALWLVEPSVSSGAGPQVLASEVTRGRSRSSRSTTECISLCHYVGHTRPIQSPHLFDQEQLD